jgi:hypothetical protein
MRLLNIKNLQRYAFCGYAVDGLEIGTFETNIASSTNQDDYTSSKSKQEPKLTKHGFLDKIKSAASASSGDNVVSNKKKGGDDKEKEQPGGWNALKDDYLLNPKKVRI